MMFEKVIIVGFGIVGQANAIALSLMGYPVYYYDVTEPTRYYLDNYAAVYERVPQIGYLHAQDSNCTFYIVCVNDTVSVNGDQDITEIEKALDALKNALGRVILRSTVLPEALSSLPYHYYVPEFLRIKSAVEDSINPSWLVIGAKCGGALPSFLELWRARARKVFIGSPTEAAFIKYLSNIWNATRIAIVNELGSVIGTPAIADNLQSINRVVDFVFDHGNYVRYGKAFGGECLPKDIRAFLKWANEAGNSMAILDGVYAANEHHARREGHARLPEWFSE